MEINKTKIGLQILQIALGMGILGDVLLRQTPWGLNVFVFNIVFAGALLFLLGRHAPGRLTGQTYALLAALVFFASMFAWRDAIELRVADTIAILTILGVLFLPTLNITARVAGVLQYAIGFVWAAFNSIFSPVALLAADIRWNEMQSAGWRKNVFAVVRGVLVATPLLLIFGALFMAADAVYEGWIKSILNVDIENFVSHGLLFALFAWLTAGYFRGAVLGGLVSAAVQSSTSTTVTDPQLDASRVDQVRAESGEYPVTLPDSKTVVEHLNTSDAPNKQTADTGNSERPSTTEKPPEWSWAEIDNSLVPGFTFGSVEIGVILGLINLLFLSFVIVQVPYLFGGMELVQNTPDFKLSDYARRGFGELVAVAGLVLPMLLASHWLVRKDDRRAVNLFRGLAGVQIVLLFVIMASAVQRLVLLTGDLGYGLTTVRLYPLIFMTWMAIVFIWFLITVLRGARKHFAWGALWAAFAILGGTHVLNPDALIVSTNVALMQQGREFDASYNSDLSDDALPVLFEAIPEMSESNRETIVRRLAQRFCEMRDETELRSWNVSRSNARALLVPNSEFVEILGGCENVGKFYFAGHRTED